MQSKITKGMVLNLSSNADVYARGEKYYRDGKLLSFSTEQDENGGAIVKTTVEGNYKNYDISLIFDKRGSLSKYSCTCESHSIWRGACKHVVAALFAYIEGGDKAANKTQSQVRALTDTLEKIIFDDITGVVNGSQPAAQPVVLQPVFHYKSPSEVYLTFSIGRSRMYILKNVSAFAVNVSKGETVQYGSGFTFTHTVDAFAEESRPLVDFIVREEALFTDITKQISKQDQYLNRYRTDARSLPLTERNIDEFFEIYNGKEIEAEFSAPARLKLSDGLPDCKLSVSHVAKGTQLTTPAFQ
jgi:uncharacterized Zn finger protein